MLSTIRENYKRSRQIFGISTRLLFCVVWIEVFALGLKHTKHAADLISQKIISPAIRYMELELHLFWVE